MFMCGIYVSLARVIRIAYSFDYHLDLYGGRIVVVGIRNAIDHIYEIVNARLLTRTRKNV